MADLSEVKLYGVHMAGTNVTKNAELFCVARCTVPKVMTTFKKEGNAPLMKQNSG